MLKFEAVSLSFGGVAALQDVSFEVADGEICGLIGPNGAGKTSLFNCANRLYRPTSGEITLDGTDLLALAPHQIASHGLSRTYQNLALFETMTVLENTMVGAHHRATPGFLRSLTGGFGVRRDQERIRAEAFDILCELELDQYAHVPARGMPFGTLKRIELARAIISRPRALLLDEPAGGLTREEVSELGDVILAIRERHGFSVLMVEHHLGLVGQICDSLVALNFGRVLVSGPPAEVRSHPEVVRAYLGGEE